MARIDPPARVTAGKRLALATARRWFGKDFEPMRLAAHHRGVFWSTTTAEGLLERSRRHLPAALRDLVTHRVATLVGCPWCIDFGAMLALRDGLTPERLLAVPRYATSPLFDDVERRALAFADAATATPPTVTDAQVAALRADLGDAGLVELAHLVALENQRSRLNHALGLTAQGYTDAAVCPLPGLLDAGADVPGHAPAGS